MKNKSCSLLTIHYSLNKGFTLVEILLVVAIIGILAGVLMVGIGSQRERARGVAALESVRGVMPFIAECYLKNNSINVPDADGGESICGTGISYPAIGSGSTIGCGYTGGGGGGNAAITVACNAGTITCDYTGGVHCDTTF